MSYTYIIIDLILLVLSFVLLITKKSNATRIWKPVFFASLASGVLMALLTWFFVKIGVWSFNDQYLSGIKLVQLPLESLLFCFAMPAFSLGVYNALNNTFPKNDLQKFSLSISNLLLGVCFAMLFFAYTKWYSVVTFSILFLLLFYIEYINTLRFMYRFYRTYAILLLIYIFFTSITQLAAISYLDSETMRLKFGTAVFEDYFYLMSMLLFSVYCFEWVKHKINN